MMNGGHLKGWKLTEKQKENVANALRALCTPEAMEEKYGLVKMKALEESLKCTLDSLSELTIFFKLRTVDGTGVTGDTAGELMSGQML